DRLARAAAKAEVDVLDLLFVERQVFALPLSHQVDAAAGRFSFQAGDAKRRACVQAQAAVHAGGQVVIAQALERFQITYRPGLRMCFGSNAPFNLLITSSVGGGEPQAPTFSFTSSGAAISSSDPPAASATFRAVMTAAPSSNHQWAIPTPGDAHHRDPWGSVFMTSRSFVRGTAIRAQRSAARCECCVQASRSVPGQPSVLTVLVTASGLPKKRAITRPSEKSSIAEGATGAASTASTAGQPSCDSTVTSC